jgi:hypothetical protein
MITVVWEREKMYKAFMFLLVVLILTIIGSFAVMAVCCAVDVVKDIVDDWRKDEAALFSGY